MPIINQISSANTFFDWLNATQALIDYTNYFSSNVESALVANTDAWIAKTDAETANTNAWIAKINSENANANCYIANTNAQLAKTAAEIANINAQSAKTDAETANTNSWIAYNNILTSNLVIYISTEPTDPKGTAGDKKGYVYFGNTLFYYCSSDYDGSTNIWSRITSTDSW